MGHEHHAYAVGARAGEFETRVFGYRGEQGMRQLEEQSRAITRFRVAAAGPAMDKILQNLDALKHHGMGLFPVDIGYKAKSTRVVLVERDIHSLGRYAAHVRLSDSL